MYGGKAGSPVGWAVKVLLASGSYSVSSTGSCSGAIGISGSRFGRLASTCGYAGTGSSIRSAILVSIARIGGPVSAPRFPSTESPDRRAVPVLRSRFRLPDFFRRPSIRVVGARLLLPKAGLRAPAPNFVRSSRSPFAPAPWKSPPRIGLTPHRGVATFRRSSSGPALRRSHPQPADVMRSDRVPVPEPPASRPSALALGTRSAGALFCSTGGVPPVH